MGLFKALDSLLDGTAKTAGKALKTGVRAADLDVEGTLDAIGDTAGSACDTVGKFFDNLFS